MYYILPLHRKLYPALSPRRRRMAPSSRSRTIYVGNGSLTLGSNRICTNYIHPHPPHKSFAERNESLDSLVHKRPSPPVSKKLYQAIPPRRRRMLPQPLANDLLRERIAHIGKQSDLHKLYPNPPPYKSFAELFQKRPFPRSPRSPKRL